MTSLVVDVQVERLGWVLIHSLWQFLAIALLVRLLELAAGRDRAKVRYFVGIGGLTAMTAAPLVTWLALSATSSPDAVASAANRIVSLAEAGATNAADRPNFAPNNPISPAAQMPQRATDQSGNPGAIAAAWAVLASWLRPWLPTLVVGWLLGVSLCTLRPMIGWRTLRRLRTQGVSAVSRELQATAQRLSARLGLTATAEVLKSTLAHTPMVVGYLRPVLLIPAAIATQLPVAELEAILAHELAHVRRHDFLVNLWQTALETMFFYHPAVWSMSRRMRIEREHCCDDLALSVIGDRACYGRALLSVEELRGPEQSLAFGFASGSLAGRIQRLFNPPQPPTHHAGMLAAICLPGLILASVVAAIAWGAPGVGDAPQPSVAEQIKRLSDPSQAIRDATAAELRVSFVPPPREPWDDKLKQFKPGMTREEVYRIFDVDELVTLGRSVGENEMFEECRLDEKWAVRLWLTPRDTPASVTSAEIGESLQHIWVEPPQDFSGRWTVYFVSGAKSHEIDYRDGKYDGEFAAYHPNGVAKYVQHHVGHVAHGMDTGRYPSGILTYEGRYFRGDRIGTWTHYDENGRVRSREELPIPREAADEIAAQANREQPPAVDAKQAPAPTAAAADSLNIVIAQHVIVWNGRVRSWDEVVTELREIRQARGKPIHPHFYFTNGAHAAGQWDIYHDKVFEIYKELFEPAGVSFGSVSPRAGPRYDAIRKQDDLGVDSSTLRTGVVVEKGRPKAGVLVMLVPQDGLNSVYMKPDLTLRDTLDEVWTVTGADGRFSLPVRPIEQLNKDIATTKYAIAAITPTSYALVDIPAAGAEATIDLQPMAHVELAPVEGKLQSIVVAFSGGLPANSPGFTIYGIALKDRPLVLDLPPGKISILRSFQHDDSSSRSYPAETVWLASDGKCQVSLPNITEQEAEQKWIEDSVRPKTNATTPEKQ